MGEEHRDRERGHADREGEEGIRRPHQLGPEHQSQQRLRRDEREQAQPACGHREQPERHAELAQRVLAPV